MSKSEPAAPAADPVDLVHAVIFRGGEVLPVTRARLGELEANGEGRAATPQDLAVAGVDPL